MLAQVKHPLGFDPMDIEPEVFWGAVIGISCVVTVILVYCCCNPCEGGEEEKANSDADYDPDGSSVSGPPDEGCCINCMRGTLDVFKGIWGGIKFVFVSICEGIAYCWYPTKERCSRCCNNCNEGLNPERDPGYSGH